MGVPIPKQTIYDSELNVLRSEAMLDLLLKQRKDVKTFALFLDVDSSREIRNKGIVLRLELIQKLRSLLKENTKNGDHYLWFGNDEFLIIISAESHSEAMKEAERIRELVEAYEFDFYEPVENVSFKGYITVTGGLVDATNATDALDVIRLSKLRMGIGKIKGKNLINIEGDIELIDKDFLILPNEMDKLRAISELRGRNINSLVMEAIETMFVHYPQFHGHRNDFEKTMLESVFLYACSPTGIYGNE
ncbi:diguanylate cyclase domain-containing protein [Lysinibacillus xylanilyticus]|uniref:diguanylate cyclase domain-containing protein n=1 Tax=Lysinibacillus xylanilyticus TaxID=582475 RepID=UPI003CFF389D